MLVDFKAIFLLVVSFFKRVLVRLQSFGAGSTASSRSSDGDAGSQTSQHREKCIEDYKPGYPQYTALIAAHDSFFISRRFGKLRARLLLQKQDKLSMLETELEQIDADETAPLFLGSSRDDMNGRRQEVMRKIDNAMADYDEFITRSNSVLALSKPNDRDVVSLQNWLDGNACLSWEESDYLKHYDDLASVAPVAADTAATRLELWIEDILIRHFKSLHENLRHNVSKDENVFIFSNSVIRNVAKLLVLVLLIVMLVAPLVICNYVEDNSVRIGIIIGFLALLLIILSLLFKPKTIEMLVVGATYATVITVFVAND
ncbi:hypothetical protein ACJ41O_001408 [Fusarium nematophilum]